MIESFNNSEITAANSDQTDYSTNRKTKISTALEGVSVFDNPPISAFHPLSHGQQALWFLYQIDPESVAYNIFTTVRISSKLDIEALRRAWNKIIERHAILRTTYTSYAGTPVQRIHEKQEVDIQITDASNWSEDYLREQIFIETDCPFNLETDSVLRINLFTQSVEEHILLLTMHHIAGDLWSFDILLNQLQTFYIGEIEKIDSQQEDYAENLSYIEFVRWQSELLSNSRGEELREYWQKQLAGELSILNLPTDKLRPPVQTYQEETHILKLDEQLIQKLRNLAITSGTSLDLILLSAFYVQLYRYTQQEDILVGIPMASRWSGEFKETVGYLVNEVVLRTSVSGKFTFTELLSQVTQKVQEAQKHQDYPFPLLVEQLQQERDSSRYPLFQASFNTQKQHWYQPGLASSHREILQMEPYLLGYKRGVTSDLDVLVMEAAEVLQVCWQYNTDLFDLETIARMTGHLQTLLEEIATNPEQRISELPLLTQTERQQLLFEWNNTTTEYLQDKCIHQLFEEQVERSPDAVAVVFEEEQLTYRELNTRANQLAHYLRSLGVGPEVLVGICVERSIEMIVGLLGVLKAGGAYVPLDIKYPQERLAFMLSDAQVPVLLTHSRLLTQLTKHSAQVICLDTDWDAIGKQSSENLQTIVLPKCKAYVLYTSGSTGRPKAVIIEHRSTVAFLSWATKVFTAKDFAGVLAATSICFDLSVFELFAPLSCGGKVILVENALALPSFAATEQVTLVNTVPSAIAQLLRIDGIPASVRTINLAGEPLAKKLVQQLYQNTNIQQVFNLYGPSEDTTYSTFSLIQPEDNIVSIGRPIANTQIYILDSHLKPLPIGIPGELYISGAGLARGYLNRPDLTDEKFIPNPFSNEPGSRLYKTGDLARYLPNGNIEYLGRIDNQVKIRGFRIELGEIEAALSQHPVVRETVVIARENSAGDKQLVAYLVPHQEPAPTNSDLRHFLKAQLPDYMMPSAFVVLEALPLTPNGKVDRRALPQPELRPELEPTFVAPRTPIEEILANIWGCVLGIEQVGIDDNFFELGGHSLLATQVISRVRNTLAVELPLRSLFETPTVASLAQQVENSLNSGQSIPVQPLLPIPHSGNIPLSFAQARLWFLDQLQPNSAFYNIPTALRLSGQLNVTALESNINEIIRRHEALRTNFTTIEGQPIQVIASTLELKLLFVDLQNLPFDEREVEAQRLATNEAQQPFDLEREPLVRVMVLQLGSSEYVFLLIVHHIIFDGWSTGVFIRELAALYEAKCTGKPLILPELPVQYADFAVWQRYWLTGEVLETQLNYWKQQLKDAPTLLELPTDRPRPAVQTFRGTHQYIALSLELSEALAELSKRTGVTLFMTLYAAFVTLLYRYTGSDDIVIGTPVANRTRQEIEGLIGFFVNTLALHTDLSGNPIFEQLLRRVREVALQAYTHQDLPFEQLVEALQPERSLSHTPLFQVMFALDDALVPSMDLLDLTVSSYSVESGTTKFDLTLLMENTASGLIGEWEYNSDLFDATTIERMAEHLQTLLEGIVANPQQRVSELPLLTERERHQLLFEWNNTTKEYLQDKCIHQLFESQVERSPNAIALVFEGQELTYQELNARANQLAHYLQTLGVGVEVLVGICVERSLEMAVGILGILKAGGAYVPLDPQLPQERLNFMLNDSQVKVLLTQQHLVTKLTEHQTVVVCLDSDCQVISQSTEENLCSYVQPSNLAYVIYTSGSTGTPKGVAMSQLPLCNLILWQLENMKVASGAKTLQFAPVSFDVSFQEMFSTWCSGGTLYLIAEELRRDPRALLDFLSQKAIERLFLPFVALQQLAEVAANRKLIPNTLREIITAGEQLQITPAIANLFSNLTDCTLHNHYGPSESHVVTTFTLTGSINTWPALPPIGQPINNTKTYILDPYLQLLPIGVAGELYLGGDSLAREYFNRPELTSERFILNPFVEGERLYKTGDLARYLPDGNIEFLGRLDNQVKIRGFRIELGEIETAISQYPLVKETIVIAIENIAGNKQLVAYIIPQAEIALNISDLRHFLKQKLPDYMIPSAFVTLDNLPLTPNGKVDRKSLPAPDINSLIQKANFVAPQTPTEELVASIWEKVLRVSQVGINDNFFELGGHSLLATQLLLQVNDSCGVELPLSKLFEAPTVASLSNYIEAISWVNQSLDTSNNTVSTREEVEF